MSSKSKNTKNTNKTKKSSKTNNTNNTKKFKRSILHKRSDMRMKYKRTQRIKKRQKRVGGGYNKALDSMGVVFDENDTSVSEVNQGGVAYNAGVKSDMKLVGFCIKPTNPAKMAVWTWMNGVVRNMEFEEVQEKTKAYPMNGSLFVFHKPLPENWVCRIPDGKINHDQVERGPAFFYLNVKIGLKYSPKEGEGDVVKILAAMSYTVDEFHTMLINNKGGQTGGMMKRLQNMLPEQKYKKRTEDVHRTLLMGADPSYNKVTEHQQEGQPNEMRGVRVHQRMFTPDTWRQRGSLSAKYAAETAEAAQREAKAAQREAERLREKAIQRIKEKRENEKIEQEEEETYSTPQADSGPNHPYNPSAEDPDMHQHKASEDAPDEFELTVKNNVVVHKDHTVQIPTDSDLSVVLSEISKELGLPTEIVITPVVVEGTKPVPIASVDELPPDGNVQVWPASIFDVVVVVVVIEPSCGLTMEEKENGSYIVSEVIMDSLAYEKGARKGMILTSLWANKDDGTYKSSDNPVFDPKPLPLREILPEHVMDVNEVSSTSPMTLIFRNKT